ncbi:hypothetical protein [Paracidovorax cattleyae]|uniref:CopL family metal-binding regulatory protein n=1 Tax=Paracidovorax cattleyae TaxID=80868 RepID=A0A1H0RKU5_9BURK|nr:hypothetical protein [Paracidovorax cattleyae]SDP29869.1 hypothetical protein SAMN04489708_110107 [Paracidovorax cattleyae]
MRRRIVFFALIVLMALRGLMGPAMAAQMAGMTHAGAAGHPATGVIDRGAGSTVSQHAEHADQALHATAHAGHGSASPDPMASAGACHGEAATHVPLSTACSAAAGDHAAHATCADCEICHTVVMVPPAPAPGAVSHGAGPRVPAAVRFVSALPTQATKPPIS